MVEDDFFNTVAALPDQIEQARAICQKISFDVPEKIGAIYLAGMGGSGAAGRLAKVLVAQHQKHPIELISDYFPLACMQAGDLLVAVSYSGNTEETLSVQAVADKRKVSQIFISSGGKLLKIAESKKINNCEIPGGLQPRAALGYLLVPLLYVFAQAKMFPGLDEQLNETVAELKKMRAEIGPGAEANQNAAQKLAAKIYNTIPVIYSSTSLAPAAYRFKCQLNENAKMLAHIGEMTEANHNEIEGLGALVRGTHNFSLMYLRFERDFERVKKQMEITKSLVGAQLGGVKEVFSRGNSVLCQMLSLVYFLDIVSVYVAQMRQVDPAAISAINKLKKEMQR